MQTIRTLLAAALLVVGALPAAGQTIKTLGYNTTNGHVVYSNANPLRFTNEAVFGTATSDVVTVSDQGFSFSSTNTNTPSTVFSFEDSGADKLRQNARTNLGLGATWLTNTNVTNFRSAIGLGVTNAVEFGSVGAVTASISDTFSVNVIDVESGGYIQFSGDSEKATTRTNLGLGATWLTNTNVTNFRTAIGLGQSNGPTFAGVTLSDLANTNTTDHVAWVDDTGTFFSINAATTRTNLGLGVSNIVTFAGITNNGDIRINQTAPTNGLLFVYRTNNESFLGLANLIASNNVTVSNETLFRVGVAEATNKAAQFGFRATNTNGTGVAVFSTFGNNALMMIGASDRSQGQAAIEADIWTISPTNRVMTLRDTNTGAMTMHRDIGFAATLTNAAPTNTNTPAVWLRVWVGTNNYRLPLYQ